MTLDRPTLHVACAPDDDRGGIVSFHLDPRSGMLRRVGDYWGSPGLRALARHPSRDVVYGVGGGEDGTIVAISVSRPTPYRLNAEASGGSLPCALAVDPTGRFLLTANYLSGDLALHRLREDGGVGALAALIHHQGAGPDSTRQEAAHLHQVHFDPAGPNVLVTDLGADAIYAYRLDADAGILGPAPVPRSSAPPGSGPRHLAFHPSGHVAVADELSSTVSWYRYSRRTGELAWHGSVAAAQAAYADGGARSYPSEVAVTAGGSLVLVANRGRDTIGCFSAGPTGLAPVAEVATRARWSQHFVAIGQRLYCAGQHGGEITMLPFASTTGTPHAARRVAGLPCPTWILAPVNRP